MSDAQHSAAVADSTDTRDETSTGRVFLGHVVAGAVAGIGVGLFDGWLAAERTGLEPLTRGESTAAVLLRIGLHLVAGALFGLLAGSAWWTITRWVSARRLRGLLLTRRALVAGMVGLLVVVGGIYWWGESRLIEWHAIDWRGSVMVGFALCAYPFLCVL